MTHKDPLSENILEMDLDGHAAIRFTRCIANDSSRVFFTRHAESRMEQRGITRTQVLRCLRHGRVVEGPARSPNGNWQLTMEVFSAGEPIKVVLALDYQDGNMIIIITAFRA